MVPAGAAFVYGVSSQSFTIYSRYIASPVQLQLISDSFTFTPSILHFNQFTYQASFSLVPTKVGPAVISYNIIGGDPAVFTRPAPTTGLKVTYRVHWPASPQLHVGVQSPPLVISVEPAPTSSFVLNLASSGVSLIISPSILVFTPTSPAATFTILPLSATIGRAISINIPGYSAEYTTSSSSISLSGRDAADSTAAYAIPLVQTAGVIVLPGSFSLRHPRYQMDVTSKVTVEISILPRSDVVLTLFANNLDFEPSYVVFVAGGATKQHISVTPRHTTSYELDYESFKVDYVVSGTNANDYSAPSESLHYIALPRGYIAAIVVVPLVVIVLAAGAFLKMGKK